MNQPKARWEEGLESLFADIKSWAYGTREQHTTQSMEKGTQSHGAPLVVNNVYTNTNDTKTPLKSVTFGFMTIGKIIILTAVIGLTIKVLMNPTILINGIETVRQILHTI